MVLLTRPWIAHLDELIIICGFKDAKDGVRMTIDQAIFILISVVGTLGVHLNEVVFRVMFTKLNPDFILGEVLMSETLVGTAAQGASSPSRVSTDCVGVVSVELAEGLLQNRSPEGLIGAHLREDGVKVTVPFFEGQEIVDNDRVRDSERVEVHSVDAPGAHLIVHEDSLNAARDLREGRDGGQEPAVADRALADIRRSHTVGSEERVAVELLSSAVPLETGPALVALSYVAPEERRVVGREVSVAVIFVAV